MYQLLPASYLIDIILYWDTFIFQWILSDEAKNITCFEMGDSGSRLWL